MSNLTLVWVSKNKSRCQTISISKPLIFFAILGGGLLLCMPIVGSFWVNHMYKRAIVQENQNHTLKDQLAQKDVFLKTQLREAQVLWEEKQLILGELHEIRNMENKIRRFLGLNERPLPVERSNQGGMGPLSKSHLPQQHTSIPINISTAGEDTFFQKSKALHNGLQEILAYLNEKQLQSRRIPQLLPVASEKVWLSGRFGWRKEPISGSKRDFHYGIDIAGPWKSPIIAPADAKVLKVGKDRYLGIYVKLGHSEQIKTLYGHLAAAAVKVGQTVKRGEVVGYMGNTGRSTGTHLHYGVLVNGKYVNPLDFVWNRPFKSFSL